jgi:tRNA1Val (adenine37-N6)-methyltransferase
MSDYSQPDFYRFNEDSFRLIRWVQQKLSRAERILDLGAGSGIMGIELSNHFSPLKLTMLEMQRDFLPHLEKNVQTSLSADSEVEIVINTFGEWRPSETFDLIVCNPPYFSKGQGRVSPDERKQMARTFMIDDWNTLINLIKKLLSPNGLACLVIRSDESLRSLLDKSFTIYNDGQLWILELSGLDINRD